MKERNQRSVYVEPVTWELAKDMAWKRRMSVSALFCQLLQKESNKKPPKVKTIVSEGPIPAGEDR